jgi:hypothetical protein
MAHLILRPTEFVLNKNDNDQFVSAGILHSVGTGTWPGKLAFHRNEFGFAGL